MSEPTARELIRAAKQVRWVPVEALVGALEEALGVLDDVQWCGYAYIGAMPCPSCGEEKEDGHELDCPIGRLLA